MRAGVQELDCQRRTLCSAWLPGGWHRHVVGHVEGQKGAAGQAGASVGKPWESKRGLNVGDPGFRRHRILLKGMRVDFVHKQIIMRLFVLSIIVVLALFHRVWCARALARTQRQACERTRQGRNDAISRIFFKAPRTAHIPQPVDRALCLCVYLIPPGQQSRGKSAGANRLFSSLKAPPSHTSPTVNPGRKHPRLPDRP